jgi:hypothetical protein
MRNQPQMHRRTARCLAVPQDDKWQKLSMSDACLVAGAIIALWSVHLLPNLSGSVLEPRNMVLQRETDISVNRLHKSDQIFRGVTLTFDERWSAIATVRRLEHSKMRTEFAAAD